MGALLSRFLPWLRALAVQGLTKLGAWGATAVTDSYIILAVEAAVTVAWGIFIAALMTGLSGLSIRQFLTANPFEGFPASMMALVAAAFPVHFAVGLVTAYIVWKFTYAGAVLIVNRAVRFLFGS